MRRRYAARARVRGLRKFDERVSFSLRASTLELSPPELQWRAATALEPEVSVSLAHISRATVEWQQLTPFAGVSVLTLRGASLAEPHSFHVDGRLAESVSGKKEMAFRALKALKFSSRGCAPAPR